MSSSPLPPPSAELRRLCARAPCSTSSSPPWNRTASASPPAAASAAASSRRRRSVHLVLRRPPPLRPGRSSPSSRPRPCPLVASVRFEQQQLVAQRHGHSRPQAPAAASPSCATLPWSFDPKPPPRIAVFILAWTPRSPSFCQDSATREAQGRLRGFRQVHLRTHRTSTKRVRLRGLKSTLRMHQVRLHGDASSTPTASTGSPRTRTSTTRQVPLRIAKFIYHVYHYRRKNRDRQVRRPQVPRRPTNSITTSTTVGTSTTTSTTSRE